MLISETTLIFYLLSNTAVILLLTIIVVMFIIIYQRRMYKKQQELNRLEALKQKSIIETILTTKEAEQRRIAHELHDEVGSQLTILRMKLIHLGIDEEIKKDLKEELSLLSSSIKRISNEMLPSILAEFGLEKALKNLVKNLNETKKTNFRIESFLTQPLYLNPSTMHSFYLLIKELLTKIQKHSDAKEACISLRNVNDNLHIVIQDDGKPFQPEIYQATDNLSLGLNTINGRILSLKAKMKWKNGVVKGNKVTIIINNNDN
jgi:signal transduction histidine kinase